MNLMKQVSIGERLAGIAAALYKAYNRLIVGDTNVSGQRFKVYYECTIGHVP